MSNTQGDWNAAVNHIRAPRTWAVTALLALAVAASVHAWGSPLTFIPVALYLGSRVVVDVAKDVPPWLTNIPVLVGLGAGTLLAAFAHFQFGWHQFIAVAAPALVTVGAIGLVGFATIWRHLNLPPNRLLIAEGVVAVVGGLAFRLSRPESVNKLQGRASDLFGREGITEATSLFSIDQGIILKPLAQIGFGFYLGQLRSCL
ncbi:hypothetical protein [Halovenus salina]|uniref:Uncharacterized protein n=1 Tax=Halovenus salina TaxID=1510225 RepID=A0ABD5VYM0_9EURY